MRHTKPSQIAVGSLSVCVQRSLFNTVPLSRTIQYTALASRACRSMPCTKLSLTLHNRQDVSEYYSSEDTCLGRCKEVSWLCATKLPCGVDLLHHRRTRSRCTRRGTAGRRADPIPRRGSSGSTRFERRRGRHDEAARQRCTKANRKKQKEQLTMATIEAHACGSR